MCVYIYIYYYIYIYIYIYIIYRVNPRPFEREGGKTCLLQLKVRSQHFIHRYMYKYVHVYIHIDIDR